MADEQANVKPPIEAKRKESDSQALAGSKFHMFLSRDSENVMGKRVFWDNENVTPPLWGVLPMP